MLVQAKAAAAAAPPLETVFDLIVAGGPLMWPLGLCSIIGLAYATERAIRLRQNCLVAGPAGDEVLAAAKAGDVSKGLAICERSATPAARVLAAGLSNADRPFLETEKAVEDAGAREVKKLSANLRPLVVVAAIAPLLGLLGTVQGMIQAFIQVALHQGLGKPEVLASGIAMALVTTAAGLLIAIPVQAAYYYFRSRIDRFARDTEEIYDRVREALRARRGATA